MIVRKNDDDSYFLINQTDHALLSGIIAAHWGNETFAKPSPTESVIRAAAFHDAGWRRYEAAPHFDDALGRPPTFTETPLTILQLNAYQDAIDWLSKIDLYAGLLITRHRLGLWRQRYGTINKPPQASPRPLIPEAEAFIAHHENSLRIALADLDPSQFERNYRLLQCFDLLSLALSMSVPKASAIAPVPIGEDGDVDLTLEPLNAHEIRLSPYPFDRNALKVGVLGRLIDANKVQCQQDLQREYFGVLPEMLTYIFVA
jgi:hypothetical protein